MNRNRHLLLIAGLMGVAMAVLLWLRRPTGPTYQGRDVEGWLRFREDESVTGGSQISFDVMPDVLAAFQAMGDAAVPPLVEIAFRSPRGEWLRRAHEWLRDQTPWLHDKLPTQINHWFYSGQSVPFIADAALGKLKPPAAILFPLVTNQLAATDWELQHRAMALLTCVGDRRETAVGLLVPFVSAGDIYAIGLVGTFEGTGSVAVPQLMECLSTNGDLARAATHCLGRIGPPASAALPALRKLFDQEHDPKKRVRMALNVSNIEPSAFWAESETRDLLVGTDPDLRVFALGIVEHAPQLARRFESELTLLVRSSWLEPRLVHQALRALSGANLESDQIVPVLVECLKSKEPVVRIAAAGHLLDIEPTNALAFGCITNSLADDLLWQRWYHPVTPEWVVERFVRLGPLAAPAVPLLRKYGRPYLVDDALKAIEQSR